jgi:hypothetical protein
VCDLIFGDYNLAYFDDFLNNYNTKTEPHVIPIGQSSQISSIQVQYVIKNLDCMRFCMRERYGGAFAYVSGHELCRHLMVP